MNRNKYSITVCAIILLLCGILFADNPVSGNEYTDDLDKALKSFKDKDYAGAVSAYTELINKVNATYKTTDIIFPAYMNRGMAYLKLNKLKEAIDDFTIYLKFVPGYYPLYRLRAQAYADMDMYKEAIEDISFYLKKYPNDIDALAWRGNYYTMYENYKKSIEDFSKVIKLDPKNSNAYSQRGISYILFGEIKKGLNDLEYVEKIDSNFLTFSAYFSMGKCYIKINDTKNAVRVYKKALEMPGEKNEKIVNDIQEFLKSQK